MTDAVHDRLARNLASGALTLALADIAEEAGRVILPFWRSDVAVRTKADQSPVTLADQKAEALRSTPRLAAALAPQRPKP